VRPECDGTVRPLCTFGEHAGAMSGGRTYQVEKASLSLQRVHLFSVAQTALRRTGVGCGL